jgi:leader peptidase (prepilin peptidase)/N-methyltransferase
MNVLFITLCALQVIIGFIIGAILGCFYATIMDRINKKMSITKVFNIFKKDTCFCFNCNHILKQRDMIPIISYLKYKGKCKYCGGKIGLRNIYYEFVIGLIVMIGICVFIIY